MQTTADLDPSTTAPSGASTTSAAFFDLGGSLLKGSATIPLAMAAARAGFLSKREMFRGLRSGVSFLRKGADEDQSAAFQDRILGMVRGRNQADLMRLADRFMNQVLGDLRPGARTLLQEHRAQRQEPVIISAAPTEVVTRLARELDVDHALGTRAGVDSAGRYTGRLDGPFCHQSGKAQVIRIEAERNGWDLMDSIAYAGSWASLPMLEAVGHPRVVDPDRRLRGLAASRGWPIIEADELTSPATPLLPGQRTPSANEAVAA